MSIYRVLMPSPAELAQTLAAQRAQRTFLAYRRPDQEFVVRALDDHREVLIGRSPDVDIVLEGDAEVSRVHARLERSGRWWTLVDDGLSRNGTFVDGERVTSRRRLTDGAVISMGRTSLLFRAPIDGIVDTVTASDTAALGALTPAERRTLVALCRPVLDGGLGTAPAGNARIARELSLTVDGVKARIKALFAKLEVEDLPHHHKRAELARRAIGVGLVTTRDVMPVDGVTLDAGG